MMRRLSLPSRPARPRRSGGAAAEWELKDGGLAVEAHADDHGRGVVRASIDIAAPPAVVFNIILDCDRAARMSPGVKRCRVVSRAPDRDRDPRTHGQVGLLGRPCKLDLAGHPAAGPRDPLHLHRRRHPRLRGVMATGAAGSAAARTRVTYDLWATAPFAVPAGLVSAMMRRDVPQSLRALRRECEGG
ncbi:SRPBCC family protein [Caulobacter segnis]